MPESHNFGPEEFRQAANVSRETLARLKAFVGLLKDWNQRHNLVSQRSLEDVWRRHVWDSAQLADFVPHEARSLVDLGSGAGFPGVVLAILLRERPGFRTALYEATRKKCEFLRAAVLQTEVAAEVVNGRIEDAPPESFDVVAARACAPLSQLLLYAARFQGARTRNLFLKGQNVGAELTEAHKYWKMQVAKHPSRSDPSGTILVVESLGHAG
ncbi:MAG TPA: 16S rRNA (guanine(527)-N(7))-methyltransferase RsmG [Rhizomicrobium sp.]|jgi:16S rRNA (guanine527-N7)-methyltransferase|nr:16S rRNA (guanine(527)-N(7))-methyltransferase RsmG [Rhizomicrobium sp.]